MITNFACPLCGGAVAYTGATQVYCPHCTNTVIAALGTPLTSGASAVSTPTDMPAWLAEVRRVAHSEGKIQAVKLFREHQNCGLKEAVESVEAIMAGKAITLFDSKPAASPDWLAEVQRVAHSGNKIHAVKLFREHQNCGLKEALDSVEALMAGKPLTVSPSPRVPAADGMAEVKQLMQSGQKIQAIKRYRELTGLGLAEAKNAVEQMIL